MPDADGFCVSAGHLMGSVSISGAWKGRIEVRLAEGLARAATAAMLMQPPEEVSEADSLDAIREIANMIGGVIKSALPRPTSLSLPESSVAAEGTAPGSSWRIHLPSPSSTPPAGSCFGYGKTNRRWNAVQPSDCGRAKAGRNSAAFNRVSGENKPTIASCVLLS